MREPQGFFLRSGSVENRTYWVWSHPVRLKTELPGLEPPGSVENRTYRVWGHKVRLKTELPGLGTQGYFS